MRAALQRRKSKQMINPSRLFLISSSSRVHLSVANLKIMSDVEDQKDFRTVHLEDSNQVEEHGVTKLEHENVVDVLAADYIDPTIIITPEENKRLRRKAFR